MDFKNFEGTTTYAIEAVYKEYWDLIPEKYRLFEKAQRQEGGLDYQDNPEGDPIRPEKKPRTTPLSYKKVEQIEQNTYNVPYEEDKTNILDFEDEYSNYVTSLNDRERYFDVAPFFDPELSFENRLHYKLANINYPKRLSPWFVITWNYNTGILHNALTRRRFTSNSVGASDGKDYCFNFKNTDLDLTIAITSNTLQGLNEIQENILVGKREKYTVTATGHSLLGEFPVRLDTINSTVTKLPRDRGTLCVLTVSLKIGYMVIGNIQEATTISEISTSIQDTETAMEFCDNFDITSDSSEFL